MVMIALPPFLAPLAAVIMAVIGSLAYVRRPKPRLEQPHDWEERFADLVLKHRHPYTHRARRWMR